MAIRGLHELFPGCLHPVLAQGGFSVEQRESIAAGYVEVSYAISNSRPALGSMNDPAFHYEHTIMMSGGLRSSIVPAIISDLDRMPVGALELVFPITALKHHLEAAQ